MPIHYIVIRYPQQMVQMAFCDLSHTFHNQVTNVSQHVLLILLWEILTSPLNGCYCTLIDDKPFVLFYICLTLDKLNIYKHTSNISEGKRKFYEIPTTESFHKVSPMTVSEEVTPAPPTESRWKKPQAMMSYVHQSGECMASCVDQSDESVMR